MTIGRVLRLPFSVDLEALVPLSPPLHLESSRRRLKTALAVLAAIGLLAVGVGPAQAASFGTGAISIKGPNSELLPGTTVEIRQDTCEGAAVWRTTTGSSPQAYGAFGIGLDAGTYCVRTLEAPPLYGRAADQMITMQARPGNWFTVWLPGPVTGAVVAKDSAGKGVNGVTSLTTVGTCDDIGGGVWLNTTATSRWSTGGYGIALTPGTYCTTTSEVPAGYQIPEPVETVVTAPGPVWITLWLTSQLTFSGTGPQDLAFSLPMNTYIMDFACPACDGAVVVSPLTGKANEWLSSPQGPYTGTVPIWQSSKEGDGPLQNDEGLRVVADSDWTLQLRPVSEARTVAKNIATGAGDDVVRFAGGGDLLITSESRISVSLVTPSGTSAIFSSEVAVNEAKAPAPFGSLFSVSADGPWTLDGRGK